MEGENALNFATSSSTPPPDERCCLLELPTKLRMTIFEIYIQEPVEKNPTRHADRQYIDGLGRQGYKYLEEKWTCLDTMDMIDECGILKRRSHLLQSCHQVLLDALPAYEKYLATCVPRFKEKLDRFARWVGPPVGYDKLVKVVDELRRVIKELEQGLKARKEIEKAVVDSAECGLSQVA